MGRKPPGTAGQGCDIKVGGLNYDALSWNSKMEDQTLWEVRTNDWSKSNDFVRQCVIDDMIKTFKEDCEIAVACGYKYVLGIADFTYHSKVNDHFAKAGWPHSDMCSTRPLQNCR
jgi:hypothetical protein